MAIPTPPPSNSPKIANLSLLKNTKKKLSLSHSDRLRRNPVPWIGLIVVSILCFGYFVVPLTLDWLEKRSEISSSILLEPELQDRSDNLGIELEEVKNRFFEEAKASLERESQFYPKEVSIFKMAKILEIYALLLNYELDSNTFFDLESVNFSDTRDSSSSPYKITSAAITFSGSKDNINNFIDYLEKGELPSSISRKFRDNDDTSVDFLFLKQNLLPIATIESVRISDNDPLVDGQLVQLQVTFYSQP